MQVLKKNTYADNFVGDTDVDNEEMPLASNIFPCANKDRGIYDFKTCDRIEDIDSSAWDSIIPEDNIMMRREYLALIEEFGDPNVRHLYVIAYQDRVAVAALLFQLLDFSGEELKTYIPRNKFKGIWYKLHERMQYFVDRTLTNIHWKILISGNIFVTGEQGFYTTAEVSKAESFHLLREAVQHIRAKQPKDKKIQAYLISDLYEDETQHDEELTSRGFRKFPVEQDMILTMDPNWENFDDYLQSVSSKYRVRAKKTFKRSKQLRMVDMSAEDIRENCTRIFQLYRNVMDRAHFSIGEVDQGYFVNLKERLGDTFKLFAYYLEDRIVGFITTFQLDKTLEVHYVGLDYSLNKDHHVYQRILYDNVARGIDLGVEQVHYGRTAPEIKSTIGALPVNMYCYLKHTNPVSNIVVKALTRYLRPKQWIVRKPFKDHSLLNV